MQQLKLVEHQSQEETFMDKFQDLAREWSELQSVVAEESIRLPRLNNDEAIEALKSTIAPMVKEIQENMERTSQLLNQELYAAGALLRSANDHRQASKAYYSVGFEDHEAMFFDEKK